jgi:hypothetical protein
MSLQEAQQFVVQFIKGEYAPGDYAAFLQWLKGATVEELTIIADIHESMQGEWVLPEGPSAAWVMQLEQKLNESVEETVTDDREFAGVVEMNPRGNGGGMFGWPLRLYLFFCLRVRIYTFTRWGPGRVSCRAGRSCCRWPL